MAREVTAGLCRVGCVVLDSDLSFEPDLAAAFAGSVGVHVTRIRYPGEVTTEALSGLLKSVVETSKTLLPTKPSLLVYACTSGSFVARPAGVASIERQLSELGPIGLTAISAVVEAIKSLDVKQLAILSPYSAAVTQILEEYLTAVGINVGFVHLMFGDQVVDDITLQAVGAAELESAIDQVPDTCDAVFVSCTGIRMMPIIEDLEAFAGRPVISSNLAIIRSISVHAEQPVAVKTSLTELPMKGIS